jgi:hypothetical protein
MKIGNVIKTTILVYGTGCRYILSIKQIIINTQCHNDINGFFTCFSLQMSRIVFITFRNSFSNINPESIINIKNKYFP